MKNERWYVLPWAVTLGGAIFGLILTMLYDYLKSKPVLSTMAIIYNWSSWVVAEFLNIDLKVWWVLTAVVILFVLLVLLNYILNKKNGDDVPSQNGFLNYRTDIFKAIRWSWYWHQDKITKSWSLDGLNAHCPKCDTTLIDNSYMNEFSCPRCDNVLTGNQIEQPFKIQMLIHDNIRRKIYPGAV